MVQLMAYTIRKFSKKLCCRVLKRRYVSWLDVTKQLLKDYGDVLFSEKVTVSSLFMLISLSNNLSCNTRETINQESGRESLFFL